MKDLTIWVTYHDDKQIKEFRLEEDETFHLFKGNDLTVEGEKIDSIQSLRLSIGFGKTKSEARLSDSVIIAGCSRILWTWNRELVR